MDSTNNNLTPTQAARNSSLAGARIAMRQHCRMVLEALGPVLSACQAGRAVTQDEAATLCEVMRGADERVRHLYTVQLAAASRDEARFGACLQAFAPVLDAIPPHRLVSACHGFPAIGCIIDGQGECAACHERGPMVPIEVAP